MSGILTTAELRALGRVFAAEIRGHLPLQSKAKIFRKLCESGMVEPMEEPLPEARSPAVILDRALANARRDEQPRGWLSEALHEAADPHTMIEAARTFVGVAGLVLVILSGLGG